MPIDVTETRKFLRPALLTASIVLLIATAGCGAVAAPCRVGSAALKVVPIVGDLAAAPTDGCANVIDPDPVSKS